MDSDSLYHFYCVGIKQLKKQQPISIQGKYIKCSKQELYKIKKEYADNPEAYMNRMGVNVTLMAPNGSHQKPIIKKYLDMEVEDESVKK